MKYAIDHDYHIHTKLSSCSNHPDETVENILAYAKNNSLSRIAITDHYWDSAVFGASEWYEPQDFSHISMSKPLPEDPDVKFLFGCEAEIDKNFTLSIPESRFDDFDFIIISTTHMHMTGFTISEDDAKINERRAALWVERFDNILKRPLPFSKIGIAHLTTKHINRKSESDLIETLNIIPDAEMERLFTKASLLGAGIELNRSNLICSDNAREAIFRPFKIAKACGCKFYLGSDAHTPKDLSNAIEIFKLAIDTLSLTESDKFYI